VSLVIGIGGSCWLGLGPWGGVCPNAVIELINSPDKKTKAITGRKNLYFLSMISFV